MFKYVIVISIIDLSFSTSIATNKQISSSKYKKTYLECIPDYL